MQFADPRATATAYLILRHLYDGDVIEWPVPDDSPHRDIFTRLEADAYVARWDRIWPLHDRYRLTEKGIALIESVYRPAGSEAFFDDLRRRSLSPEGRRSHLTAHGLNPALWPLLHDPSAHWSTFFELGAGYHTYVWEDRQPPKRVRPSKQRKGRGGGGARIAHHHPHDHVGHRAAHLVDLDRQARDEGSTGDPGSRPLDYDVS